MKKILYGFLFLFFAITQGYYLVYGNKYGERKMDYNQAIGLKKEQITQMNFGYRIPNVYNLNITNREKINSVIDFLQKQQFIKQEPYIKPDEFCNQLLYRVSFYTSGDVKPRINITLDAYEGKRIIINNTSYVLFKSNPSEIKNLFKILQEK